jgi:hypothetical protein
MIIRQALFEGAIHPGKEQAFRDYVETKLAPMWLRFPTVMEVRVLYGIERDEGAPAFPMVLSTLYGSREDLEVALASDVRHESREMTKGLLEMFDGRIHHHVLELAIDGQP